MGLLSFHTHMYGTHTYVQVHTYMTYTHMHEHTHIQAHIAMAHRHMHGGTHVYGHTDMYGHT